MATVTGVSASVGLRGAGRPALQRFADGFGRVAVVTALLGLVAALVMTAVPSVVGVGGSGDERRTTYHRLAPAAPARVSIGRMVAPVVASDDEPIRSLVRSPVDVPLVTWWSGSAEPGATTGQTVLTARTTGTTGGLSAIGSLDQGDTVDVLTDGGTMRYRVDGVRSYTETSFGSAGAGLVAQDGGHGRLVMISAQAWDGVDYQDYVVLTGTPLGEPSR